VHADTFLRYSACHPIVPGTPFVQLGADSPKHSRPDMPLVFNLFSRTSVRPNPGGANAHTGSMLGRENAGYRTESVDDAALRGGDVTT
jgi:hypothetical protein